MHRSKIDRQAAAVDFSLADADKIGQIVKRIVDRFIEDR